MAAGWAIRVRGSAALLVLALAGSVLAASAAHAAPSCAAGVPDRASATRTAKACAHQVEDLSARSAKAQDFVNPDGSHTLRESVRSRFTRSAQGTWVDVDPTLAVNADGSVSPRAGSFPLVLSGGGTGPVVRATQSGHTLALSWPGRLPAPVLTGSTATYVDVLPAVDLQITVDADSFTHNLVVRNRAAAANPALRAVPFGLSAPGLTVTATPEGGLVARDAQGAVPFASAAPLMWDAQHRQKQIPVAVKGDQLILTPDATMLSDAGTVFPLVIDPSWTGLKVNNGWTTVWSKAGMENSSFWQNSSVMSDGGNKGDAGAGLVCDLDNAGNCTSSTYLVRSLFAMDLSAVQGKHILSSTFDIKQKWAWTCNGGGSNAKLWVTGSINSGTTWKNQPGWDGNHTVEAPGNHRYGGGFSCSQPDIVEFTTTGIVQYEVASGQSVVTLGLRAKDETTTDQWKRFDDSTAALSVTYNSVPNTPDQLTIDGKACGTGANKAWVSTVGGHAPTLRTRVGDADSGDHLNATFSWTTNGGTPPTSATPATVVHDGYTSVYTIDSGTGHLHESFYTSGYPWATQDLSTIVGIPAATGGAGGVLHGVFTSVFTVDSANGHLQETFSSYGQPWQTHDLSALANTPAVTGTPVALVHDGGWLSVYTIDSGTGHLQETYFPPSGGNWATHDLSAVAGTPAATGSPGAVLHGAFVSVYTVDSGTNHLQETYSSFGNPWLTQDMATVAGTPAAATGTPAAVVHDGGYTSVYTVDSGTGHLQETYMGPGGPPWHTQDLSAGAGTPAVAGSPAAVVSGSYLNVFTVDAGTGHLQQTYFTSGNPWHTLDFGTLVGTPAATASPATALHDGGYLSVYTENSGTGHLQETVASPSSGWYLYDLTSLTATVRATQSNVANGQYAQTNASASMFTPGAVYSWSASSSDGIDGSPTGGPCEFTVDNAAPNTAPTVTSTQYPADNMWHDGVGKTGMFTLGSNGNSDGGVNDVVAYRYGSDNPPLTEVPAATMGGPVTVPFTPTQFGINDFYARSVDRAGNLGPVIDYEFFALGGSDPVGAWALDETGGTTAADTGTGHHPATLHGTVTRTAGRIAGSNAVHFNGTDTDASTAVPVLNTTGSYTVSAWVKLPSLGGTCCYTVLSEDSSTNTPFFLRYNGATDRWTFTVVAGDAQPTTWVEATGTTPGVAGVWTHVAGVYDAGSKQAMLYVNGALAATAAVPNVFAANGPLVIGRGKWAGNANTGRWRGDIDEVRVWDRVVTPDELTAVASATQVGKWNLDEPSGTTASGTTAGGPRPATLSGGVGFTSPGHTAANTGSTTFDGTSASISAAPVLHTDQSYTVSAWAKLPSNPGTGYYAVLGQEDGSACSAFFLRYNANAGRWEFSVVTSPGQTAPGRVDVAGPAGQPGVWVHLVGVYDAGAKQARLYVNGQKVASAAVPQTFDTTGALVMGQDKWAGGHGDFWRGGIDDVRVYQGVLSDQAIGQLATT